MTCVIYATIFHKGRIASIIIKFSQFMRVDNATTTRVNVYSHLKGRYLLHPYANTLLYTFIYRCLAITEPMLVLEFNL